MFIKTLIFLLLGEFVFLPSLVFAKSITGRTIDSVTGLPVGGVRIYLTLPVCSTFSNSSSGEFELIIPATSLLQRPNKMVLSKSASSIVKVFNLNGRVTLKRQLSVEGCYVAVLNEKAEKVLSLSDRLTLPIEKKAEESRLAKTASSLPEVIFEKSGYQITTKEVLDYTNLGEILLPPENVVADVSIEFDSIGVIDVETKIVAPDTGVIVIP